MQGKKLLKCNTFDVGRKIKQVSVKKLICFPLVTGALHLKVKKT